MSLSFHGERLEWVLVSRRRFSRFYKLPLICHFARPLFRIVVEIYPVKLLNKLFSNFQIAYFKLSEQEK